MDDNNWDLFAVVRGCSAGSAGVATAASDPFSSFLVEDSDGEKDRSFVFFPDPMDTSSCPCEPQELCNPSSHEMGTPPQLPPVLSPTTPLPPAAAYPRHSPQRAPSQTPRSKRKKSQQKKVVCQVPADGAHSDLWAWRKYGQKPIKGSPYPRGYYRCSSSKGCQARKQVERSRADPRTLLITYTAEHNHPIPAHRNSIAGSTRQKLPPTAASPHLGGGELFISQRSRKTEKGEEGEEEEGLVVGSVESLEEDDDDDDDSQLLLALDTVRLSSAYMEVESSLEEHFLSSPWLTNLNAAAAAGGR